MPQAVIARGSSQGSNRFVIFDLEFLLVISHWSLVIGHWSLIIGHWSLNKGQMTNDK
ncbi:hypothetical protein GXM_05733 [Nostoc sphaeroides CCNUC1]|uniref:Uncharacterized protein n=1 Tax=Nostoc sphaeroides CCNUC1 TaxID=2653204 RepID=A0A5P8W6V6_9NOSO|nr:hypothetical protein GXM_05733 [Nostoc sphaeroides CCNUC1]